MDIARRSTVKGTARLLKRLGTAWAALKESYAGLSDARHALPSPPTARHVRSLPATRPGDTGMAGAATPKTVTSRVIAVGRRLGESDRQKPLILIEEVRHD